MCTQIETFDGFTRNNKSRTRDYWEFPFIIRAVEGMRKQRDRKLETTNFQFHNCQVNDEIPLQVSEQTKSIINREVKLFRERKKKFSVIKKKAQFSTKWNWSLEW